MKINVDKTKCIGCGACVAIAPTNFDFDENGLSSVINDEINESVKDACESCPFQAISIKEDDKKE